MSDYPVPAAVFDFSALKAGDTLILHAKATSSVDLDGDIETDLRAKKFGETFYLTRSAVHSVIPSKTLRERAIEAVAKRVPEIDVEWMLSAAVDAVLTEVEKGR